MKRSVAIRLPSPAMFVALTALFVAMGGTGYAASQLGHPTERAHASRKSKKPPGDATQDTNLFTKLLSTKGLAQLTGYLAANAVPNAKHAKLADTATNAIHASGADTATNALNATNATTASNALALGGIPASGYTRSDCNSTTGQIKGFTYVPASGSFSSSFVNLGIAYNCSGQAVQAKRIGAGDYEVKFLGNPAFIAVGTVNSLCAGVACEDFVSVDGSGGDWLVSITPVGGGPTIDLPFELIVP